MNNKEFPANSIRICFDDIKAVEGSISGVCMETSVDFRGKRDLIVKIDQAFDAIGQPQPHQVIRSFQKQEKNYKSYIGDPARYHTSDDIRQKKGEALTVDMIMTSRHHTEWQGFIVDEKGEELAKFESSLDFFDWLVTLVGRRP
ncbi:MAG: hypothetical protein HUJ75_07945 [Parasporobacterium sp.]|nr:hypothetical protein [Parasporobacterium sp.]